MAGHYAAAGDQPAALRATVQAALAARDVHAYGEAAELAERALELWPRVPDATRSLPLDHVDLLTLAAAAHSVAGDRGRAEVLLTRTRSTRSTPTPSRGATPGCWRASRESSGRSTAALEAVETAQRALSLLPGRRGESPSARSLMAWLARIRFLRGRFRDAIEDGEAALAVAGRRASTRTPRARC